jgi:hypothetical protein
VVQTKSDEEVRAYHRKRISEKSVILVPAKIEEPTEEQKEWIERKMKGGFR